MSTRMPAQPGRPSRRRGAATWLSIVLVTTAAALGGGLLAQRTDPASGTANFDIRVSPGDGVRGYLVRVGARGTGGDASAARVAEQQQAVARLAADRPNVDVIPSQELHTPEIVTTKLGSGFLTGPAPDRVGTLRTFLTANATAFGLRSAEIAELVVVADYENPAGNMAWVELEQRINGLPVFRGRIRGAFTRSGELVQTSGTLAPAVDATALSVSPAVSAPSAIVTSAARVGWTVPESGLVARPAAANGTLVFERGPLADEPRAWLLYFPLASGVARLAWATEIWGASDSFLSVIDAETSDLLFRKNMTEYQSQAATYNVYLDDSPAPMSPSTALPTNGAQAGFIARTSATLVGNEAPNTFNNLGWITDNTNGVNGLTDGNNVEAGLDRVAPDGVDSTVAGVGRVFNFAYDPATQEPLSPASQNGEVTDAFYWTNLYHDRLYRLGFTESSGNFQNDNFGRGGVAADRIRAEMQDSSSTNNANFTTPADGGRGRMQMYLFPNPAPDRTSGLDHDVLLHELTHGLSNRLHVNGAGLTSTMARAMGEGWSDVYARALLSTASEPVAAVYPTGGWVTYLLASGYTSNYYYGIRRFPYAPLSVTGVNGRPHNPLTFADIDSTQMNLADGAYPNNPILGTTAFQVHNAGEVWASALFEVRARLIARLGFATGNERFLQFVTDGMKLDGANPTFLSGRNAILTAALAGGGTVQDLADIWAGFAVRGMGVSAQITDVLNGRVVQAFDVPGITAGASALLSESLPNGRLDPTEVVGVSLCIVNNGAAASGSVLATLQASGGVTAPSAAQSYGAIAVGATVCRTFTFTVSAACGAQLVATLATTESGGSPRSLTYTMDVGSQTVMLAQAFDAVAAPALPGGWTSVVVSAVTVNAFATSTATPDTAPNRAFAANPNVVTDNALVSPVFPVPATGATVSFRNSYSTEPGFDGGVLELAIAGGPWQDVVAAGGTFLQNGYNASISAVSSPLNGRSAWTGSSGGYVTTSVRLPAAASGQNVQLRWRLATDDSVSATGWGIDTTQILTYTCGGSLPPPPAAFAKTAPGNGATGQSVAPTLTWATAVGATSYEYCVDTSNNNTCNTAWVNVGSATSASLAGLLPGRPYVWQVRAANAGGSTEANANAWFSLTTAAVANPLADLAIDFGAGVGLWMHYDNGGGAPTWAQLHGVSPTGLARANLNGNQASDLAVAFAGSGLWAYLDNATWQQLHPLTPSLIRSGDLDGNGRDELVVEFPGQGLWIRYDNASWAQLHPQGAVAIAVGNVDGSAGGKADVIVSFAGFGTYAYLNNSSWTPVHNFVAQAIQLGDIDGNGTADAVMQFATYGEYILYNNTTWVGLHPSQASSFVTGNLDNDAAGKSDVLMVFPGFGTYVFLNGTTWVGLHPFQASVMTTGDLDGNGADDAVFAFPGNGIWSLKNLTTWAPVHPFMPEAMAAGRVNSN